MNWAHLTKDMSRKWIQNFPHWKNIIIINTKNLPCLQPGLVEHTKAAVNPRRWHLRRRRRLCLTDEVWFSWWPALFHSCSLVEDTLTSPPDFSKILCSLKLVSFKAKVLLGYASLLVQHILINLFLKNVSLTLVYTTKLQSISSIFCSPLKYVDRWSAC